MSSEARQILDSVREMKGRYGINIVIGTLKGSDTARLREIGAGDLRSFGKLKGSSGKRLKQIINQMIQEDYLCLYGDYNVLKPGYRAAKLMDDTTHLIIGVQEEKEAEHTERSKRAGSVGVLTKSGYELFDELRALRLKLARESNLPPYVVFSDKTLIDMCVKLPRSREEMFAVSGVAAVKYERYGETFLKAIGDFIERQQPLSYVSCMGIGPVGASAGFPVDISEGVW